MSDKNISSFHTEKLGHHIEEIRIRALQNIISKLNYGFMLDNNLSRSKEILLKLFQWFTFEQFSNEHDVLKLMKQILETKSGLVIAKHLGITKLITDLKKIKSVLQQSSSYNLVDSIIDNLNSAIQEEKEGNTRVPPLISEVPLSYRSDNESYYEPGGSSIGKVGTPISGLVFEEGSGHLDASARDIVNGSIDECRDVKSIKRAQNYKEPFIYLSWIPLVTSDTHVLTSVEESLRSPSNPAVLLHTCDFFKDVMLQDFPPEVFLQRPAIILQFFDYITKTSSGRFQIGIMSCFNKLIGKLITKIELLNDPHTFAIKSIESIDVARYVLGQEKESSNSVSVTTDSTSEEQYRNGYNAAGRIDQLKLPDFCCDVILTCFDLIKKIAIEFEEKIKKSFNYARIYNVFFLISTTIDLLVMCVSSEIWYQKELKDVEEVLFQINNLLAKMGENLEYIRIATVTNEENKILRVIYLHLLCNCVRLIGKIAPENDVKLILTNSLKVALVNSLSDAIFAQLYPKVHNGVLLIVQKFQETFNSTSVRKYKDVSAILSSISSSVKFLQHFKDLSIPLAVDLADEGLISTDLHRNMNFVKKFIFFCSQKGNNMQEELMTRAQEVILKLLAYNDVTIQQESYKTCHKIVVKCVGPIFTSPSDHFQILFLLNSEIFIEIATFGINHVNKEIRRYAEDILIYILKCKVLVPDEIWNKVVEVFIGSLPFLICHVCKPSPLGRTVLGILDPDVAQQSKIPKSTMLKGNIGVLFVDDSLVREEVISRLFWLLSSQANSIDLSPRFSSLPSKDVNTICQFQHRINVNKCFNSQQYYQANSVIQILDFLHSETTEPVVKRSALTQLSVMLEDPSLHPVFLDREGIKVVLTCVEHALNEKDHQTYPDSVVPAISVLKSVCMYSSRARQELKNNVDALLYILRGVFAFSSEERVKTDAGVLLFFLVFGDFVLGNPKDCDVSVPHLFFEKLSVPFECNKHWKTSKHCIEALAPVMMTDKWNLNSIKIHWNAEWYGGISNVLKWDELPYNQNLLEFNEALMLSELDLKILKNSCIDCCLKEFLESVHSETSHRGIMSNIDMLICFLTPYVLDNELLSINFDLFLTLPWKETFSHFLNIPPADGGDVFLLSAILRCLKMLVLLHEGSGEKCWIVTVLQDDTHCLPNILEEKALDDANVKVLHQELLDLISTCAFQENRSVVKRRMLISEENAKNWNYVIKMITENMKESQAQYFYNLAYLDYQLSCLVHLTGSNNWGGSKEYAKESVSNLVRVILDLVTAFHEGKGHTAALSLMGIGIMRNSLLILNHLLVELQKQDVKNWETLYIGDNFDDERNCIKKIFSLKDCRDVLLRASALQLLAGLSTNSRAAAELNKELWTANDTGHWYNVLEILLNYEEARIVRESAANLLSNLAGHIAANSTKDAFVTVYLTQTKIKKQINCSTAVMLLIEEFNFFKIIHELIVKTIEENVNKESAVKGVILYEPGSSSTLKQAQYGTNSYGSSRSSTTVSSKEEMQRGAPATPGFLRYLASFIQNLLTLSSDVVVSQLLQLGLLPLFFRCICNPAIEIITLKDQSYYWEIIEMNIAICSLLTKAIDANQNCVYSLINSRDCLHFLLGLLNTSGYYTYPPQFLYLRNRMWKEIFTLVRTVLTSAMQNNEKNQNNTIVSENIHNVISSLLAEDDNKTFLQTVSEAIVSEKSIDLQNSALTSLTTLLSVDVLSPVTSTISWGCLLDTVKTPRTQPSETVVKVHDYIEPLSLPKSNKSSVEVLWTRKKKNTKRPDRERKALLQNLYFPNTINLEPCSDFQESHQSNLRTSPITKDQGPTVAGGELCRILMYLYKVSSVDTKNTVRKMNTVHSLTNLLCVSQEAKKQAVEEAFMQQVVYHLRELHVKLSLESADHIRDVTKKKKKAFPALKEVESLIGLVTNFMYGCESVKKMAADLALADLTHKLWLWFNLQKKLLLVGLKMLCTFTANCEKACRTLLFTSSLAGSGPKKSLNSASLINEIFALIAREMDQVSRTHDLQVLELCLHLLQNCCISSECRQAINKSNLYQCIYRLHPALTKGQRPWDRVELLWMEFLQTYTAYSEGQTSLTKSQDAFSTILTLASGTRSQQNHEALLILRNISFNSVNRPKLLNSSDFLNILYEKLSNGSMEDKNIATIMMWALSANNQRAKLVFKCSGLKVLLKDLINRMSFTSETDMDSESLRKMQDVYNIIKED